MGLPCSSRVPGDRPEEAGSRTHEHPPPPSTDHWGLLAPVAEVQIEQVRGEQAQKPPGFPPSCSENPQLESPSQFSPRWPGGLLTPELSVPGPQSFLPCLGAGEASESTPHTPSRYQSLGFVFALFRLCVTLPKGLPQLLRTTRLYLL